MGNEKLVVGKKAPSFTLDETNGIKISLKDFLEKWVVVYFYPRDNTPGCTIEAIDFTALKGEFEKENCVVLGVSKDSCASHKKFVDKKELTIILLSDPDHKMQDDYGVWKPKKFMGKEFLGTVRTTFLINTEGKIAKIWNKVNVKRHAQEVLDSLRELK